MSCACASEPRHPLTLKAVHQHSEDIFSFDFESPEINTWREGDSAKLYLTVAGEPVGRKFSFASLPGEACIRFTTRIKPLRSDFKSSLAALKAGEMVELTAPQGEFALKREQRPIVLLSNGVGIAAMRSLIKAYEADQTGVPVLYQLNVDGSGALYEAEFNALAKALTTFQSAYTKNRLDFYHALTEVVKHMENQYEESAYYYAVGSEQFVTDVTAFLNDAGIANIAIVTDSHAGGCDCGSKKAVPLLLMY